MSYTIAPPPGTLLRSNFYHLYADIFWFGVTAGSAMAFIAVYAARLGANSFQVGLLTAGPAVVNLLFSLHFGKWLEGRRLVGTTFRSSIGHRLGYLILAGLPWFFSDGAQIWAIVAVTLLMSIPGTLLAIAFNALFADVVPPEYRGLVVGRRNALVATSVTVSVLLSGRVLDLVDSPFGYQIVFGIGALGALMSSYHLSRLRYEKEPAKPRPGQPIGDFAQPGVILRIGDSVRLSRGLRFLTRSSGKPFLRLDVLRGPFGLFMAAYLFFYAFQFFPLPLFPLYFVNVLHLSDGSISLGSALFHVTMMFTSLGLGRVSSRYANQNLLVVGGLLFAGYPLLLYLAWDATIFWAASCYGGMIWSLLSVGLVNRLMERVPEDDRPAHMALHNLALNMGILAGSLLGPLAGEWLGLKQAILLSGGLRLIGGLILWLLGKPLRRTEKLRFGRSVY